MVDFRYHLVSIIAIFLALALGIVVGTTQLNGQVLDSLNGSIGNLTSDKRTLEGTVSDLRKQVASDEKVVDSIDEAAVAGVLAGQRVVVLSAPDSSAGSREDLTALLDGSGAVVSGTIALRPELVDPANTTALEQLVAEQPAATGPTSTGPSSTGPSSTGPGPTGPISTGPASTGPASTGPSSTGSGPAGPSGAAPEATAAERAYALLARALLRTSGEAGPDADDTQAVVAEFERRGLVDVDGTVNGAATLAVVLAGPPPSGDGPDAAGRAAATLRLAQALDAASSGCVLAGPLAASEDGGLLGAVRSDPGLSAEVSTVDGADRAPGRLATVFALREQLGGGAGQYGTGRGSNGPLPATTR